jgi:hypothetical protein
MKIHVLCIKRHVFLLNAAVISLIFLISIVGEIPTSSSKNKNEATQFLWLLSREAGISGHATGVLSNF